MQIGSYTVYELIFSVGLMFFCSFCYFSVNAVKRILLKEQIGSVWKKFLSVFIWWIVLGVLAYLPLKIWHYACIDGIFFGMIMIEFENIRGGLNAKKREHDNLRQGYDSFGQRVGLRQGNVGRYP